MRILLLGGTSEASALAKVLAEGRMDAIFSYAGRTGAPLAQPLTTRVGGFGGVAGLVDYLHREAITHVVDATHPFAEQMSRNAFEACARAGANLIRLERASWQATEEDQWNPVPDMDGAVRAVQSLSESARIFLAIGKQHIGAFSVDQRHHYLLRLVDDPKGELPLRNTSVIVDRGPFAIEHDRQILRAHYIGLIVSKNSGGSGAYAKIAAARDLGIPIIMIERPVLPGQTVTHDCAGVLRWLHHTRLGV